MGFRNAIVAGKKLVIDWIQSPNFITGVSGWIIRKDGSAEFLDITARGTITADQIKTSDVQTDPRIWINNPATDPNVILYYTDAQPDSTPIRELAKITGPSVGATNTAITIRAWGTDTSDTEDTEILVSGHPNGFVQITAEDQVFVFAPGTNGSDGFKYNTQVVLTAPLMRQYVCACTTNTALAAGGFADITGMSITFNTEMDNAQAEVTATFDTNCTAAGAVGDLALYQCLLDGVQVDPATPYMDTRLIRRELVPGVWQFSVPTAGTHTVKIQGRKNAGSAATVSALTSVSRAALNVADNGLG